MYPHINSLLRIRPGFTFFEPCYSLVGGVRNGI